MPSLSVRDYSLSPLDLIDMTSDDQDDQLVQERARQYAALKRFVNLEDLIVHACSKLPAMIPVIAMAQDVLDAPPDPKQPRGHPLDLMRVGQAMLDALTEASDEQISLIAVTHGRD